VTLISSFDEQSINQFCSCDLNTRIADIEQFQTAFNGAKSQYNDYLLRFGVQHDSAQESLRGALREKLPSIPVRQQIDSGRVEIGMVMPCISRVCPKSHCAEMAYHCNPTQMMALTRYVEVGDLSLLAATGTGKTLIIYACVAYYFLTNGTTRNVAVVCTPRRSLADSLCVVRRRA
jgi:hypothetical protein